jgi:DNA-binding response OmpR family regulator
METRSVLLIEDSAYLAESVKDALEMHGYAAHIALNGEAGVRYALAQHPDLILLDIRLPDTSGYEVYRQIRADDWGKEAKISVLTASESLENIAKNINLPVEHILFKPAKGLAEIIAHVEQRLDRVS